MPRHLFIWAGITLLSWHQSLEVNRQSITNMVKINMLGSTKKYDFLTSLPCQTLLLHWMFDTKLNAMKIMILLQTKWVLHRNYLLMPQQYHHHCAHRPPAIAQADFHLSITIIARVSLFGYDIFFFKLTYTACSGSPPTIKVWAKE